MSIKKYLNKSLLKEAIPLDSIGLNEISWKKEFAQSVIACLQSADIGILGGDVYRTSSEGIVPVYDNWYCNKDSGESDKEYFYRSKLQALDYISNYCANGGENFLFTFVFTEPLLL